MKMRLQKMTKPILAYYYDPANLGAILLCDRGLVAANLLPDLGYNSRQAATTMLLTYYRNNPKRKGFKKIVFKRSEGGCLALDTKKKGTFDLCACTTTWLRSTLRKKFGNIVLWAKLEVTCPGEV